jgi:aldose 1-epimerase
LSGQQYKVEKFYFGEHAIHGLVFDLPYEVVETRADDNEAMVMLRGKYDGSDSGYPFPFELNIEYRLQTGNRLSVTTTVVNLHHETIPYTDGWHPYFTLGGPVDEWTLQFNSGKRYGFDEDLMADGSFNEDLRFENGISLAGISLDHSFELQQPGKCVLRNARLSLTIEPDVNYPVLQVYTPDTRKSIAIENLSGPPDNFNNGMHLHLLQPGETKSFSVKYTLTAL